MELIFYNGEHSATFGNKNSWTDWHLISSSKVVIPPPNVRIKRIEIPGVHGSIDLSNILTGYPTYENRSGTLEYILEPGYSDTNTVGSEIMQYLHGRSMNLYLDDDPGFYYTGTFYVKQLRADAKVTGVSIEYSLYPFKHEIITSDEDWLWDPFNFETGVIRSWDSLTVDGSLQLTVEDCAEPVLPVFTVSSAMTLTHVYYKLDGTQVSKEYALASGRSMPGLTLRPGQNTLTFTGNGTVTISFRGGRL